MGKIKIEKLDKNHPARSYGYEWSVRICVDGVYAGNGKFFRNRSAAEIYKMNELESMLEKVCNKHEENCTTCPCSKECNEYAEYNRICYSCKKWLDGCPGTKCAAYTGCLFREI